MNIGSADNSLGRAGLSSIESLAVRQAGDLNSARMDGLRGLQRDDIDSAGRKFEQLFAGLMTKELRKGLKGFFGEGPGADTFTAWMDEHLGRQIADQELLGIAKILREQNARDAAVAAEGIAAEGPDAEGQANAAAQQGATEESRG